MAAENPHVGPVTARAVPLAGRADVVMTAPCAPRHRRTSRPTLDLSRAVPVVERRRAVYRRRAGTLTAVRTAARRYPAAPTAMNVVTPAGRPSRGDERPGDRDPRGRPGLPGRVEGRRRRAGVAGRGGIHDRRGRPGEGERRAEAAGDHGDDQDRVARHVADHGPERQTEARRQEADEHEALVGEAVGQPPRQGGGHHRDGHGGQQGEPGQRGAEALVLLEVDAGGEDHAVEAEVEQEPDGGAAHQRTGPTRGLGSGGWAP